MRASIPGDCRSRLPSAPSSCRPTAPTRGCCCARSTTPGPRSATRTTHRRGAERNAAAELRDHHRRHWAGGGQGASEMTPTPGGPPRAMTCTGTATRPTSPRPATPPIPSYRPTTRVGTSQAGSGRISSSPVAPTDATVPDARMTGPIHEALAVRDLPPAEHYVDSGYPSVALVSESLRRWGSRWLARCWPAPPARPRPAPGFDRASFHIDFDARQARCPQGNTSSSWSPCTQRGTDAIVITFATATCAPCRCASSAPPPRAQDGSSQCPPRGPPHSTHRTSHPEHPGPARSLRRAGVEGTIRQAVAVTGLRRARYRGLPKTRLEHVFSVVELMGHAFSGQLPGGFYAVCCRFRYSLWTSSGVL